MKYYDNPYQVEKWKAEEWNVVNETQKTKDEIDNEIVYALAKIMAFFMAIGVIYFLFRK